MEMEKAQIKKASLKLKNFIVSEFKIVRSPDYEFNGEIDITLDPSGVYIRDENSYQLTLDVSVSDDSKGFEIFVKAVGFFEIKPGEDENTLTNYFYTNAPAIIFPYIRSYVSGVSALSGLETVNLPIMNLSRLKDTLKENTTIIED